MQERDEALDFIYKGFRDGRQNRRNVMNQRGADRIAARRERMAQYGSPSMQMQTPKMRGPPSQSNVASSPPSTIGNFTDDISTLDDESTPINEAAGSPPSLNQAFSNLGVPEHRPTGGANVGRHDYVNEGFPDRTPNITQNVPSPAEVQETTPPKDLGTRLPEGQDPFPTNYANLTDEERSQTIGMLGEKHNKLKEGTETYQQAVADGKITEQQAQEGISGYRDMLFEGLPPSMIPQPKSDEQQHKESFETAYERMKNEATQPDKTEPSKEERAQEMFNRVQNRKSERLGEEPEYETDDSKLTERDKKAMADFEKIQDRKKKRQAKAKAKQTPKPDETVAEAAKKTIKPQEEKSKKPESDSSLADKNPPKYGRLVESGKGVIGSILHTDAKEQGLTRVMMPGNKIGYMKGTPKPDKEVVETAKKTIKPKKKATKKGKSAVRAASDRLARSGMKGDTKDESPKE